MSDCNPYDNNNNITIIVLVLECVVRIVDGISDEEFRIRWFHIENTTGALAELGLGHSSVQGNDWSSSSTFSNQPYDPSLLGKYWCQVFNTTADAEGQPLMRSNVFTLLAPGDYSGSTCTTVQEERNETCADLPGIQPVQLTTLTAQQLTSTAAVSSYHTTHLLISLTPTELTPSTIAATTTMTSLPAPATSVIVYTVAGVSGGIVLVILCCCSIMILMIMMRRKTVGQATTAGQCVITIVLLVVYYTGHDNNTVELDDDHHGDSQLQ